MQEQFLNYISQINEHPLLRQFSVRTILALDGTGSMSGVLPKTVEILR